MNYPSFITSHTINNYLTTLQGKLFYSIQYLFYSIQEFIEIEAWLLPTFFVCLHKQLISIHSIVTN